MRFKWVFWVFLLNIGWAEEPWGKDADLHFYTTPCLDNNKCKDSPLVCISEVMIRFHQDVISPADGPRSSFFPSSSQYTLEAIQTYGFFRGFWMGCDRLMRENDEEWVYKMTYAPDGRWMKYDPVPYYEIGSEE